MSQQVSTISTGAASVLQSAKQSIKDFLTWNWTRRLLHWIIISAGTMSELVFLVASVWMTINAAVHPLVLLLISAALARYITYLATAAFVVLPECILALAMVTTLGHFRAWLYDRRQYDEAIWTVLYGLPTAVFLALALITIACSVLSVNFTLPQYLIVTRALAGYTFALTSLLFTQIGAPKQRERLQQKDTMLAELQRKSAADLAQLQQNKDAAAVEYERKIADIRAELREVYRQLETAISEKNAVYRALNQSDESALQAYGDTIIDWLNSLDRTVSIDDICSVLGWQRRRVSTAIERKELQTKGPNKNLIWVPSLREYLVKHAPKEKDTGPMFRVIGG